MRHSAPILFLFFLTCIFFAPLVLHPSAVLYSEHSDMLAMHLPMKRFLVRSWQEHGQLPRWCPYSYGGMPFLSDVQVAAFYPLHAPLLLLPEEAVGAAMSWLVALHVFIAGLGMFGYAHYRGLGIVGSLTAAFGFMFAGKWLCHVLAGGHYIMTPLAWLPLAVLFLEQSIRESKPARAIWAGAFFALIALGTHPQVTLYSGLVVAAWTFCVQQDLQSDRPARSRLISWIAFGAIAAIVSIALSAVQLLPALEASRQASRGIGVSAGEIVGVFGFAVREFFGPHSPPRWEISGGFGPIAIGLLLCVPWFLPRAFRWQLSCFAALVLFSFGGAVLFHPLPGFRLFQIPVRMLLPAAFPAAFLCGVSVDALGLSLRASAPPRKLLVFMFVIALLLNASTWPNPLTPEPDGAKVSWTAIATFWLADLACLVVVCWIVQGSHVPFGLAPGWVLFACLATESWLYAWSFVEVRPIDSIYPRNEVVEKLADLRKGSSSSGPWRVLDRCVPGDASLSPLGSAQPMFGNIRIEPVLGYNSFDVRRYKEFLQFVAAENEPLQPRRGIFGFPISDVFPIVNKSLLDLLGTKYVTQPYQLKLLEADPQGPGNVPSWKLVEVFEKPGQVYSFLTGGMVPLPADALYENLTFAPRAFIVHERRLLDPGHIQEQLATTDFRKTVLLESSDVRSGEIGSGDNDSVSFREVTPDRIALHVEMGTEGFLVLTEPWYPGWQCMIDGSKTAIERANFAFQGVSLTAGNHEVIFQFAPKSLFAGQVISCLGLLVLAGTTIGQIFSWRMKKASTSQLPG